MKKTLLTLTLAFVCFQYNQAQTKSNFIKNNNPDKDYSPVSYVSPKKDTLMLPNNHFGKLILGAWDKIPKAKKPVILLVSETTIERKNQFSYDKNQAQVIKN